MSDEKFSDETLMAFADDELDPTMAARVSAAMARDPEIEARVERFRASRLMVRDALAPLADLPLPAALQAAVEGKRREGGAGAGDDGGNVVAFGPRRRSASPARSAWALPLAASLALCVGGVGGYWAGGAGGGPASSELAAGPFTPGTELARALSTAASGERLELGADQSAGELRVLASFRIGDGDFCREFEWDEGRVVYVALACHGDERWSTRFAAAAPAGDAASAGYTPASSLAALEDYLSDVGAGSALTANEEEDALRALR